MIAEPLVNPLHVALVGVLDAVTAVGTVIVIVVVVAHVGAAVEVGVNVYVVVAVLFIAGDHVPTILLFDVVGNALKLPP